jgi:MFS family permease
LKQTAKIWTKIAGLQTFRPFHHRNFPLLFLSTIIASIGMFMSTVAVGWLVLNMTDSPLLLGAVWAVRMVPSLLFGMFAGVIADRVNRRKLLILVFILQATYAIVLGILIGTGLIQLWHVYLLVFVAGTTMTLGMPTRQAFVVDIVGPADAMSAISMNAVAMRIMGVFGAAAAGFIIDAFGIHWPFFIMFAGYLVGILVLLLIRGVTPRADIEQGSIWDNFLGGVSIIRRNKIVRTLMIMAIACEIFGFSYLVLLPVLARDILGMGAVGLGMLHTAQSVGGLLGVLLLASLGNYRYKGRLILAVFLLFGVFLLLLSQSSLYVLSLLLVGGVGVMAASFDALQHTMLQLNVYDAQRGRAMGIWQLSIGFGPVGHLTVGTMASLFSAPLALIVNGIAIGIIFLILIIFVPNLRKA